MAEISRFFGIVISMYAKDHLPPHLHARYGEYKAFFRIPDGELIEGTFPRRATGLVQDWIEIHKNELLENWDESQKDNPSFIKIEALR